jgi:thioredoxin 1
MVVCHLTLPRKGQPPSDANNKLKAARKLAARLTKGVRKMVLEVSEENFEQEVLKSDKPVVVDFWAAWCGPCKMIAPVFEKLAGEMKNVKFAKLNVDENTGLAQQSSILGIPCMVVYKNGEEVDRIVGFLPEAQLKAKIEAIVG